MLRLPSAGERERVYAQFPLLRERRRLLSGSLSGGEQQMLALAPALVNPPPIVVADEPTLGLAPLVVADVMRLFEELRERGTAILLVEEKARDVLEIAAARGVPRARAHRVVGVARGDRRRAARTRRTSEPPVREPGGAPWRVCDPRRRRSTHRTTATSTLARSSVRTFGSCTGSADRQTWRAESRVSARGLVIVSAARRV